MKHAMTERNRVLEVGGMPFTFAVTLHHQGTAGPEDTKGQLSKDGMSA